MLTGQEIYSVMSFLSKQGATADKLLFTLNHLKNGTGELTPEISSKISNIINGIDKYERNIASEVEDLILNGNSQFTVAQVYNDLSVTKKQDKDAIRRAIGRLMQKNVIEKHGDKSGCYKKVNSVSREIDFVNVDLSKRFDVILPLGIHKKTTIFPKSLIVIAGVTGMGKTGLLLDIIFNNMFQHKINYLSSELSPQALNAKLNYFNFPVKDWKFKAIDRVSDFHLDVLPDGLTIIDYLTDYDAVYNIANHIDKIYQKLKTGIAIVALQKKTGSKYGRSGELGAERASLYLGVEWQSIEIVKNRFKEADNNPYLDKHSFEFKSGMVSPLGGWYHGEDIVTGDAPKKDKKSKNRFNSDGFTVERDE